jgi:hypothetical protein
MGRLLQAVVNKQVKSNKIDQDLNYIVSEIARLHPEHIGSITLRLGRRPDGMSSPSYLELLAGQASQKLGALGVTGWTPDLVASQAASQSPNLNGYGNQGVKIWSKDQHELIFTHEIQLAEVVPLSPITTAKSIAA